MAVSDARLMGDLPQWAVAGGTLALALVTAVMAWKTRDVAMATRESAAAAADEARASTELVAEIKKDRDLNWRPYPVLLRETVYANDQSVDPDTVWLGNIGRGPAFNCIYARYTDALRAGGILVPIWYTHRPPVVVAPGSRVILSASLEMTPPPMMLFEDTDGVMAGTEQAIAVLFYQDTLGDRVYRLLPPRAKPEIWSPGEEAAEWVKWYFVWLRGQMPPSPAQGPS